MTRIPIKWGIHSKFEGVEFFLPVETTTLVFVTARTGTVRRMMSAKVIYLEFPDV